MKLFVYGTLRRKGSAAHLMRSADFIDEAWIRGKVIWLGEYTGLVHGDDVVPGELFEVPGPLFDPLDQYEGPGYLRALTEVRCGETATQAWVYWLR